MRHILINLQPKANALGGQKAVCLAKSKGLGFLAKRGSKSCTWTKQTCSVNTNSVLTNHLTRHSGYYKIKKLYELPIWHLYIEII